MVQGSYAEEYVKGRCPYEIDYTKPYSAYSGKSTLSITIGKNVQNDYFKNCPKLERVDLGPEVTYILPGTISDKLTLRAKRLEKTSPAFSVTTIPMQTGPPTASTPISR
ncbi:MAG: hypothetical protein K5930_13640 [Treponemataceae bacterium]|nr:hypothetical protein [Treponemataceae bacterium]